MTKVLRILKLNTAKVAEKCVSKASTRYTSHEVASITSFDKETALGTLLDSFDCLFGLSLLLFRFESFGFSMLAACNARMRRLTVAVRTNLFAARKTVEPLSFRMNELPIITRRAVFENFITVFDLLYHFEL